MRLPPDHPLRVELNDEVHARPPEALRAPLRIGYLAVAAEDEHRAAEWQHVCGLLRRFGREPPGTPGNHLSVDLGGFGLKWERHTEFARYLFIVQGAHGEPFSAPALDAVPAEWVAAIPGRVLVASHVELVSEAAIELDYEAIAARLFGGSALVGATIAGGAGVAMTDLRIRDDGFSRYLVVDRGLSPRQAGRMVQRLLEIDTYRIAASLALPIARRLGPFLTRSERELATITASLSTASVEAEGLLLDRLTKLEAEIEVHESEHAYRFGAAAAYYDLVQRRILELREERIQGLQTLQEFTARRLAPAMSTCQSVAARQRALSERVARVTQLLSTRVDVSRERQNQRLLESLDERARLQLRLQQTVEGLSVAAVTYYVVGLIAYAAKSLKAAGVSVDADAAAGVGIPIVALIVALAVRRIRHAVTGAAG